MAEGLFWSQNCVRVLCRGVSAGGCSGEEESRWAGEFRLEKDPTHTMSDHVRVQVCLSRVPVAQGARSGVHQVGI